MTELIVYSVLFCAVLAHLILASVLYRKINADSTLDIHQKNHWRIRALIFPGYFWFAYRKFSSGR